MGVDKGAVVVQSLLTMIVKFEHNGHECEADVTERGIGDRAPRRHGSPYPDTEFSIRWIADCGADQRDLDNLAIAAFKDAEKEELCPRCDKQFCRCRLVCPPGHCPDERPSGVSLTAFGWRRCYKRADTFHGVDNLRCDCLRVELPPNVRAMSSGALGTPNRKTGRSG